MTKPDTQEDLLLQLKEKNNYITRLQSELLFSEIQLKLIHLIGEVPSRYDNIPDLLDKILDTILEVLSVEACSLMLLDEEREHLSFMVTKGEKAREVRRQKLKVGEGIAGKVVKSGKPWLVPDVHQEVQWKSEISEELGFKTRNILCTPLSTLNDTFGVLELINKKGEEPFTNLDLELVMKLSREIAQVINNVSLIRESRNRINQLSTLTKVTALINATMVQSDLLLEIMTAAEELMEAEASSIMLINHETDELEFQVAHGERSDEVMLVTVPLGKGIAGTVALSGESVLVKDAQNDERLYKKVDEFSDFVTKSLICVPLRVKDEIIGVAQVLNKKGKRSYFTNDEMELFESLANQAAIAIDNARLYREQHELMVGVIRSLALSIDAKDPYTHGHSERVTMFALAIYNELEVSYEIDRGKIQISCLMHDIGKLGIREQILLKPDRLTEDEYEEIKKHPQIGKSIIEPIKQFNGPVMDGMLSHHERYDGKGYPEGLKGDAIPFIARIIAVADAFDAMTSDRAYRKGMSFQKATDELDDNAGKQFDPTVVKAFKRALEKGYIR